MPYSIEKIDEILNTVALRINISDEMFRKADDEYTDLGTWIDDYTRKDSTNYIVQIYPQGSFALGTVIRPISDEEDYDLDLVCQINNGAYLTPNDLKNHVVKPWLIQYKKIKNDIEEKRRCWHVEYEDVPNFHMDVIPAITFDVRDKDSTLIRITDKSDDRIPMYIYIGSNPKGYVDWFFERCRLRRKMEIVKDSMYYDMAMQEDLRQNKNKSVLQKTVQLLKRHRDVMFENDPDNKPISIIITTLAGNIYDGEDTVLCTLIDFANRVELYLYGNKKEDGSFTIPNPSFPGEDFADKWRENPKKRDNFFLWIRKLKDDFDLQKLMKLDRVSMGKKIKECFGPQTGAIVFAAEGGIEAQGVRTGSIKVSTSTGNLSTTGTVTVPPSHHYGM